MLHVLRSLAQRIVTARATTTVVPIRTATSPRVASGAEPDATVVANEELKVTATRAVETSAAGAGGAVEGVEMGVARASDSTSDSNDDCIASG